MNEILVRLATATLLLSVSAVVVQALMLVLRPSSAGVRQCAWFCVLVQGIVLFHLPVRVPWYGPPPDGRIGGKTQDVPQLSAEGPSGTKRTEPEPTESASATPVVFAARPSQPSHVTYQRDWSKIKSNRAVFLERLGTIYREQGNYQAANGSFREIVALGGDENIERGYQQIVDTWREAKDWQKALDTAKEAVAKLPASRDLKMDLALQQADMGDAEKAIRDVRAMLKGDAKSDASSNSGSDDRQVYLTLGQMCTRLRRFSEAGQALDKAEELSSKTDDKEFVWFLRGSALEREKRYSEAEEQFKKVIASDPEHASALNYLGYMLADQNMRLEEALGYIKRAVDLDPSNGAYLDSLGWAYFRLGKLELAEDNLAKAAQKTNADPTVLEHLGDLYQKTGRLKLAATDWERALSEWNRTLAADIDPADVARVQKKLDSAKMKLAKEEGAK